MAAWLAITRESASGILFQEVKTRRFSRFYSPRVGTQAGSKYLGI